MMLMVLLARNKLSMAADLSDFLNFKTLFFIFINEAHFLGNDKAFEIGILYGFAPSLLKAGPSLISSD